MSRPLTYVLTGILLLIAGTSAYCDTSTAPFVSGYDRFARHQEIESRVGGALLISELSCAACHQTKRTDLQPKRGPHLNGAGNRLKQDWLRRYLAAPHSIKPGTTMPDVLHDLPAEEKKQTIEALTAFLTSNAFTFPTIKATGINPVPHEFWKRGNIQRGQNLYHKIGCVACHEPDESYKPGESKISPTDKMLAQLEPEDLKELGLSAAIRPVKSVPHGDLTNKYTRKALTFFLLNPEQTRPAGRMPQLKLKAVEAADIAAYLLREQTDSSRSINPTSQDSLILAGQKRFLELKCVNCHEANRLKPALYAKPFAELNGRATSSCLGHKQKNIPYYPLDESQKTALQLALTPVSHENHLKPQDQLSFQLLQLNCYACHERDKKGGVGFDRKPYFETAGHVDLGDEGRVPPTLTGIGAKLQKKWMTKVLNGKGDIRFHMQARMPVFPAQFVSTLPARFEKVDRVQKQKESAVFPEHANLVSAGRTMLGTGCIQCHPLHGESLPGVVGTDLGDVTTRVHPKWLHEFLLNPAALKPRTRMPTFFPDGKSQNKTLLDGDVDQQIASLWGYLKAGPKQPLPEKILLEKSKNYELVPEKRPIILRTFMQEAGTHAIAVGFPEKLHFAFDAEQARPAIAWKGRFLDAQGTWFIRFAPPAVPLGKNLVLLPAGAPFALLKDKTEQWPASASDKRPDSFRGYRVDAAGIPTFLYRVKEFEIEDRIEPTKNQTLKRTLTIKNTHSLRNPSQLWFRGLTGSTLKQLTPTTMKNQAGLTVSIPKTLAQAGELRTIDNKTDWIIPVSIPGKSVIEVKYQW